MAQSPRPSSEQGSPASSPRSPTAPTHREVDPALRFSRGVTSSPNSLGEAAGAQATESIRTGQTLGSVQSKLPQVPYKGGRGAKVPRGSSFPPPQISLTEFDEWGVPIM